MGFTPSALRAIAIAAALACGGGGCAASRVPAVDARLLAAADAAGLPPDNVRRGHDLLVTQCARCHSPVAPDSVPPQVWHNALPRMLCKTGLDRRAGADLESFFLAARAASAVGTKHRDLAASPPGGADAHVAPYPN